MLFEYKNIIRLNTTEKNIYRYVVNHMDEVLEMNVRDLAEATFVSTATIVRFTQKMGCDGFNDFKEQLKKYRSDKKVPTIKEGYTILDRELHRMEKPEVKEKIRQFAQKISESGLTLFIGTGKSGYIAGYAARYMMELGYNTMAVTESFYPLMRNRTEDLTVIAISSSGETIELVDQINAYKDLGATVYSITGSETSTIAKLSDLSINYSVPSEVLPSMSKLTTSLPAMYIIEVIACYLMETEGRTNEVAPSSFHE